MLASLLSPTSTSTPRVSQLLPTVKCSTCHQPVPLAELGDHTCEAPPPVPSLPKPSISHEAATSLLPERLQGRVAQPTSAVPEHQRLPSSSSTSINARLRINTRSPAPPASPTQPSFQPKPSPLARADSSESRPFPSSSNSPMRTRPPPAGDPMRMRTPSNASTPATARPPNAPTPATARPPVSFAQDSNRRPSFSSNVASPSRGQPPALGQAMPPPRNPAAPAGYNNPPPPRSGPSPAPPGSYKGPPPPMGLPSRPGLPPGAAMNGPRSMGTPAPPPPGPNNNNTPFVPPTSKEEFVPPAERGIDTKTGGAAGMAGVGRRGFAAAARAAMFVAPPGPLPPAQQPMYGTQGGGPRRPNAPQFLDIDAATRSTETPPLSAGSGYSSSHSPGPTSPLPQSDTNMNMNFPLKNQAKGLPPISAPSPAPAPAVSNTNDLSNTTATYSPLSSRLPFFEKFKNKMGYSASDAASSNTEAAAAPTMATIPASATPRTRADSSTSSSSLRRNETATSASGSASLRSRSQSRPREAKTPISPIDSESEYGGLAYADSTDYEDNDRDGGRSVSGRSHASGRSAGSVAGRSVRSGSVGSRSGGGGGGGGSRRGRSRSPPPPLPSKKALPSAPAPGPAPAQPLPPTSILKGAPDKKGHIQFGSVSVRSRSRSTSNDRGDLRVGSATTGSAAGSGSVGGGGGSQRSAAGGAGGRTPLPRPGHSRADSASSAYSSDADLKDRSGVNRERERADSNASASAIAQALGLSRSPPGSYARLGGPGVGLGRSASGRREVREGGGGSVGGSSRSGRDREDKGKGKEREGERVMDKDKDKDKGKGKERAFGSSSSNGALRTIDTLSANKLYKDDYNNTNANKEADDIDTARVGRSNTVQGLNSPHASVSSKPIKLPTRSLTSPQLERDKALALDGGSGAGAGGRGAKAKAAKRPKTCLRCQKVIEDGRWVSVDGGGVLCERCWKGMYLPKCRRCNLPIERQAVSSSDGQLKGKYHKECFNCHICHKPFPDKSFYVYDGKPLCAYHYHEANDSLCAAARCGQPIEGPCAVSHTGDRYHPEHMTCEHEGAGCKTRLDEYWEVDGRMLCERHAVMVGAGRGGSGSEDGDGSEYGYGGAGAGRSRKAMKRVTRFIDLTGGVGVGLGLGLGAGGDSGLR
ncbi:hypothetical protein GALMADRAFT_212467 [Galerina marginata CBS 339.88]|uniref:LIM zinc-binding domain-containing protein n=1 Tax=Galerina marginata (strain CBS 339.88) TaxID=685588 RepID=A0A067T3M2_GALM3|nr:hypothetical protein GALMADRAFT_212467 [Galerina marginata CBS 339.88]